MEVKILDTEFKMVGIIDAFISLIWTDRYNEAGDFELLLPMDIPVLDLIKEDYYLTIDESEHLMIIEDMTITTDVEEGRRMKIVGYSIEKILDRRIVWEKTVFKKTYADDNDTVGETPSLQDAVLQMIKDNITYPVVTKSDGTKALYSARQIKNFIYKKSTDEAITKLTIEAQYRGESIYEIVSMLCKENQIGFKITLNDSNQFVFELYAGADRTYDQIENPYVVFSPDNDNLFNSAYYRAKSSFKNVVLVVGEEEKDEAGKTFQSTVVVGNELGIARREIFADGSDIPIQEDNETTLTDEQYKAHLKQRGIDTLMDHLEYEAFEGEVEATIMYKYGEDFFMGDYVQLEDEYGHQGKAYIAEFIISQDASGINMYPTFITLQEGDYDTYE